MSEVGQETHGASFMLISLHMHARIQRHSFKSSITCAWLTAFKQVCAEDPEAYIAIPA